jgi:hypothetical protein
MLPGVRTSGVFTAFAALRSRAKYSAALIPAQTPCLRHWYPANPRLGITSATLSRTERATNVGSLVSQYSG